MRKPGHANNEIEQNKSQYNFDRQSSKISALSLGNVSKYELLTGKDVLPAKALLEKAVSMKRCEYFSLGKELKAQNGIAKNQYQKLVDTYECDKIIKKGKPTPEDFNKSDLMCNSNNSFTNIIFVVKDLITFPLNSKYSLLAEFLKELNKFNKPKSTNKKKTVL